MRQCLRRHTLHMRDVMHAHMVFHGVLYTACTRGILWCPTACTHGVLLHAHVVSYSVLLHAHVVSYGVLLHAHVVFHSVLLHAHVVSYGVLLHAHVVSYGILLHAHVVSYDVLLHVHVVFHGVLLHAHVVSYGVLLHAHVTTSLPPLHRGGCGGAASRGPPADPHPSPPSLPRARDTPLSGAAAPADLSGQHGTRPGTWSGTQPVTRPGTVSHSARTAVWLVTCSMGICSMGIAAWLYFFYCIAISYSMEYYLSNYISYSITRISSKG